MRPCQRYDIGRVLGVMSLAQASVPCTRYRRPTLSLLHRRFGLLRCSCSHRSDYINDAAIKKSLTPSIRTFRSHIATTIFSVFTRQIFRDFKLKEYQKLLRCRMDLTQKKRNNVNQSVGPMCENFFRSKLRSQFLCEDDHEKDHGNHHLAARDLISLEISSHEASHERSSSNVFRCLSYSTVICENWKDGEERCFLPL